MLCHAHIRQLIRSVSAVGAALCLMATPHLERTRSNYTANVVCLPTAFGMGLTCYYITITIIITNNYYY